MPSGTFFDLAVVHVLTTGTIDRLRELYPQGRNRGANIAGADGIKALTRFILVLAQAETWFT